MRPTQRSALEVAGDEQAGGRLDAVIAARDRRAVARAGPAADRGRARHASAAWSRRRRARGVRAGDAIEVRVPPPEPLEVVPEDIPLAILYEDADLIVIDKPAGLVVHPAPRSRDAARWSTRCCSTARTSSGIGGVLRPGIVHRLDKDTSGVMVATKTDRAHAALTAAFAAKSRGEPAGSSAATSRSRRRRRRPRAARCARCTAAIRSTARSSRRRSRPASRRSRTGRSSRRCTTRRSCGSGSRPAARIRSACTPPITAGR